MLSKAEELHGTNALYLLAHAIHESNWGKSKIARDKNNLFGIGANDGNPYQDAWTYENYEKEYWLRLLNSSYQATLTPVRGKQEALISGIRAQG